MRLSKIKYKYLIEELENYDNTLNKIDELKRDLAIELSPDPPDGMPKGNMTGDPTGTKAIRLLTLTERNAILEQMTRLISQIDYALAQLDTEHNRVFELTYRKKYEIVKICNTLNMSVETYYRRRGKIIYEVAKQTGINY